MRNTLAWCAPPQNFNVNQIQHVWLADTKTQNTHAWSHNCAFCMTSNNRISTTTQRDKPLTLQKIGQWLRQVVSDLWRTRMVASPGQNATYVLNGRLGSTIFKPRVENRLFGSPIILMHQVAHQQTPHRNRFMFLVSQDWIQRTWPFTWLPSSIWISHVLSSLESCILWTQVLSLDCSILSNNRISYLPLPSPSPISVMPPTLFRSSAIIFSAFSCACSRVSNFWKELPVSFLPSMGFSLLSEPNKFQHKIDATNFEQTTWHEQGTPPCSVNTSFMSSFGLSLRQRWGCLICKPSPFSDKLGHTIRVSHVLASWNHLHNQNHSNQDTTSPLTTWIDRPHPKRFPLCWFHCNRLASTSFPKTYKYVSVRESRNERFPRDCQAYTHNARYTQPNRNR